MRAPDGEAANFAVEPMATLAAQLRSQVPSETVDRAFLLAVRPGTEPYALPVDLPPPGHALHEVGLTLLWGRAVTVAAAIVGTAKLRLVTEHDETFKCLKAEFAKNPKVTKHLEQYGEEFCLDRAVRADVPEQLRALPFGLRGGGSSDVQAVGGEQVSAEVPELFVGVDYGRSDVKCAVVDGQGRELATYVTRWWRTADGSEEREYLDPAVLKTIDGPLRCLGEAALEVLRLAVEKLGSGTSAAPRLCGLGLSAAGCVRDGRLCGLPPAFGGCELAASQSVLDRLERAVLEYVAEHAEPRLGKDVVAVGTEACATLLVNDGDASAMWGAPGLGVPEPGKEPAVGLFLSCGTGLAGGIVRQGGDVCGGGVLELGKLVMGVPIAGGVAPKHDTLGVPGSAQGMAGTQRSFFNLLAARGGEHIEGKAEQRAAIVAMQKRPMDDEVRAIFSSLGGWLAQFVVELSEYLPFKLSHVEAGGKLTDAASGDVMLGRAQELLEPQGISDVRRARESEFGQALALAKAAKEAAKRQ